MAADYTEADIKSLDWREHIRMRPGMYIGKLGDGSSPDDGLYILLKEAVDNSIDEHIMGHGKEVKVDIDEQGRVEVRDFGRGIPLGKLFDCAAQINTGAKYDSEAFKKSVGLNGVGIKAVNALSNFFEIQAWRDGETKALEFSKGQLTLDMKNPKRDDGLNGTRLAFCVDTPEGVRRATEALHLQFDIHHVTLQVTCEATGGGCGPADHGRMEQCVR